MTFVHAGEDCSRNPVDVTISWDESGLKEVIEIVVDEYTTNAELLDNIVSIIRENKKATYSIVIKRKDDCYTDFDLSKLRRKYKIWSIQNEKFSRTMLPGLEGMNSCNVFGETMKSIRETDSDIASDALTMYACAMSKKIWGEINSKTKPILACDEEAIQAHGDVFRDFRKELTKIKDGLKAFNLKSDNCMPSSEDISFNQRREWLEKKYNILSLILDKAS